jgi:hypothetical protein
MEDPNSRDLPAGSKLIRNILRHCSWTRLILAFVGLLLAGSIAVFLRYVALWSFLMVTLIAVGMVLMFLLGASAGLSGFPLNTVPRLKGPRRGFALFGGHQIRRTISS